jgi:Flp pilus assembly protein TadG
MKIISDSRKRRASSAGQAATEFAMIATVLFLLMFGLMTLGSAVYSYNTISSAAREAVRYAAVHSATSGDPATGSGDTRIQQKALDYAQGVNLALTDVTVSWPADPNPGMKLPDAQVQISYTYNLKIPFMSPVGLALSSTSRMLASQ